MTELEKVIRKIKEEAEQYKKYARLAILKKKEAEELASRLAKNLKPILARAFLVVDGLGYETGEEMSKKVFLYVLGKMLIRESMIRGK